MAAVGSAKSVGGLAPRAKSGPAAAPRPPSMDDVRCPVCADILLEPVTMPCGHSACLHCFERSSCCPRCRLRVSSWARKRSREKGLVNAELWDVVRRSYPEKCQRRLEQRDGQAAGEEVFRSPVQIRKQEFEKQKMKVVTSEEKEDKKDKRRVLLQRKGECSAHKHFQDPLYGVLSDSENEEPIGRRTRHVSAFVRKTRSSPAFVRGLQKTVLQRSRSCTDSEEIRGKVQSFPQLPVLDKSSASYSLNAGILLSSENSRSLSAPVLVSERRHHWRSVLAFSTPFLAPQSKAERSISPESNDSISEELNHFKPIVCSPCTPPKRLPDGRVMEPTIVKSTPRNLTRCLQKHTSYEASPTILQKWRQIEVDRQLITVTSKGTVTSPLAEDLSLKPNLLEGEDVHKLCSCGLRKKNVAGSLCTCGGKVKKNVSNNKRKLIFDAFVGETGLPLRSADDSSTLRADEISNECVRRRQLEEHAGMKAPSDPASCEQNTPVPNDGFAETRHGNQRLTDAQGHAQNRPTSQRGKKRSQKTKHLVQAERTKRVRSEEQESISFGEVGLYVQRLHQEREDREMALKLQRQFDREYQNMDRQKSTSDQNRDGRTQQNPRRSGRISRKVEHFKYNS